MHVLIVTLGSMGDLAPHTGLAVRMKEEGHQVAIAADDHYAAMVRDLGVKFHPLPRLFDPTGDNDDDKPLVTRLKEFPSLARQLGDGLEAIIEHGADADVVLLSASAIPLGWHVVEAMGVPSLGVFFQPFHPTRELPPFYTSRRSLGPWGNRAGTTAMLGLIDSMYSQAAKDLRARLGLPPRGSRTVRRRLEAQRWPVCYGFSPTVVSRPADWRPGLEVVGYVWPARPRGWQPRPELVDFLDAGPAPVLIGFGSSGFGYSERLSETVRSALRQAGVRGLVQSGSAGLTVDGDDLLTIGDVPHDWLMPRTAAVVHHAGAGTVAAGLRAGVPAVSIPAVGAPAGYDQPFWARRLVTLGVSPDQLPLKKLTTEDLARAIRQAVSDPSYRRRATTIARQIESEDGTDRLIEVVSRHSGATRSLPDRDG